MQIVGSAPLRNAREVFTTLSERLGPALIATYCAALPLRTWARPLFRNVSLCERSWIAQS